MVDDVVDGCRWDGECEWDWNGSCEEGRREVGEEFDVVDDKTWVWE